MSFLENAADAGRSVDRPAVARTASIAAELVSGGSLEMGAHRPQDARDIAALLPAGTPVYINHLPRHKLLDTLPTLIAVREAGLEPIPHIAARRVKDRAEFQAFLTRAVGDAGVRKALILGGDEPEALGDYADSAALLREGLLAASGLREIGLPGYPEGHPRIPRAVLDSSFAEKLSLAARQGLGTYIVTQFSFAPARVIEYCAGLARTAPAVPIYVGLAGPTNPVALLRFAQRCGVSALAEGVAGARDGSGSPRDPYRSGAATVCAGALLRGPRRVQRGRRALVHFWRRHVGRQMDEPVHFLPRESRLAPDFATRLESPLGRGTRPTAATRPERSRGSCIRNRAS